MYTLTKMLTVREFLLQQAPTIVVALMIAELFYKFHSFLLEAGGFLATWYILDLARQWVSDKIEGRRGR
jgi:hypothetical protein